MTPSELRRTLLAAIVVTVCSACGSSGGGTADGGSELCGAVTERCCGGTACDTVELSCRAGICVEQPVGPSSSSSSSGTGSSSRAGSSSSSSSSGSNSGSGSGSSSSSSSGSSSSGSSSTVSSSGGSGGPFISIPLTGCPFIGYNAPVTIGGQTFQMGIDTGSTDTGVALSTCTSCGVSPEYSPGSGSCTGSPSACANGCSGSAGPPAGCTCSVYGSGSWDAEECSATVSVGSEMPNVSIEFAGITDQQQFFINTDCAGNPVSQSLSEGILGLGPLDLDTIGTGNNDAYFSQLVQQGITDTLAVLLCSANGELWFGGYDPQFASGSPQYTPMNQSSGYWAVSLSSIGLGSTNLGGADSNAVVDTGTWGFYMPTSAFNELVNALSTDSGAAQVFGAGAMNSTFFSEGSCLSPSGGQSRAQIDAALQPMTLTFPTATGGSFTLSLPATESYLLPVTSGNVTEYCAGVGDNGQLGGQTIMGDSVLRANITVFDEGNNQVGFVPQTYCQ